MSEAYWTIVTIWVLVGILMIREIIVGMKEEDEEW